MALLAFIVLGLIKERQLLTLGLLPTLGSWCCTTPAACCLAT
jgi:hypothetical protein